VKSLRQEKNSGFVVEFSQRSQRDMPRGQPSEVTRLLLDWNRGNKEAFDLVLPLVYRELRKLAGGYLKGERPGHTLQPTALIHEAYLRLVDQSVPEWQNRSHFFGVAARAMRQILVEHARSRHALKRGGGKNVSLVEAVAMSQQRPADLVALDDALKALAAADEQKARMIELRYFAGLGVQETADALGISVATARRHLRFAEAWLRRELIR
jgi:RNA polymerase sigma factor (TIGR02999 family)